MATWILSTTPSVMMPRISAGKEVRYEIGILTVPEGQPWPTIEDIWGS